GRFSTRYQAKPTRANPKRRPPIGQVFTQPPKPRFAQVAYDSPPRHRLYEMRDGSTTGAHAPFAPQPVCDAVRLVGQIRDRAAARLCTALGTSAPSGQLDRLLVGRGAGPRDKSARIRLVPLPSIGHTHADYRIRRLLVEVPPDYPLNPRDIDWAFDGLDLGMDPQTGAAPRNHGPRLLSVPTNADKMLAHYGIGNQTGHTLGHTLWRTVTPAVLPRAGGRKSKQNRPDQGARAVATALRHAGITARPVSVRVQREPFDTRGARAESFAVGRFAAAHMWHLELGFAEPVDGPLVIGDGRYVGLGLMRPVPGKDGNNRGLWVFAMPQDSRIKTADTGLLLTAVRRALMALSRDAVGRDVPPMFSGHEPDGTPARSGRHKHVFLAADDTDGDGRIDRLLIAAPWICDPSRGGPRDGEQVLFDRVVSALSKLRAGPLGILEFTERGTLAAGDPVVGPGQTWTNRTRYSPTRHGRDPKAAVRDDVVRECQRRGWPAPHVELLDFHAGPRGGGVLARLRLRFATAIEGPLLLGRDCHRGGGLFVVETGPDNAIR
ncbi:MAG: type I-U CRISPR-associated protein Cas5/Cas6, partial [Rhodobacteraceae bacterium]|nr:type I-U CRISPR-associated protein Cas5/Cas6 [Paracoccaceae bacterium]